MAWRGAFFRTMPEPGRAAAVIAVFAASLHAQPQWTQLTLTTAPSARCCAAMTYDARMQASLLFAGVATGSIPSDDDTWSFSSTRGWTQLTPATVPSPRTGAALAYDPTTGTAVLFGGAGTDSTLNDTWTWDGLNWTQQFPPVSPSPRSFDSHEITFDAATGNVLLFGGLGYRGTSVFSDTWVWNGKAKTWTELFPANHPSARGTTLAYDPPTKLVVLFGGRAIDASFFNDTWTWDGVNWTERSPPTVPTGRSDAAMAFDTSVEELVMFGGAVNSGKLNDTWTWNGTTWTQVQTSTEPSDRSGAAMDYDPNLGGMVLFGGALPSQFGVAGDTWLFR